jgi:hypothetical protein
MYLQGKYHFEVGGTLKIAIPILIIDKHKNLIERIKRTAGGGGAHS